MKGAERRQELGSFLMIRGPPRSTRKESSAASDVYKRQTLLPALIERDIGSFGHSVTEIQRLIGDHFSQAQGGRYTSPAAAKLLAQAQSLGYTGVAQSSWGPTGCIFVDSDAAALALTTQLEDTITNHFDNKTDYSIITTRANSTGAIIDLIKQ